MVAPASPAPMRQMAAKGVAPGLKPAEALTVIALLSESADDAVAATARATLGRLPDPILRGALAGDLAPGVLALLAPTYAKNLAVMERIVAHPALLPETVVLIASLASESVAELVATNERLLLAHPEIIEKLYMNKATRMSTADRVLELAVRNKVELKGIPAYKEAAAAIGQELVAEATAERNPDDVLYVETDAIAKAIVVDPSVEDTHRLDEETGEEVVEEKFLPIHAQLAMMTISQRIRRCMLGNAAERLILVRDSNRLVAAAAIKSPGIQENEVVRIAASRNVSDDVLRIIALDREWNDGTRFDHSPRASTLLTVVEEQFQLLRDILVLALPSCVELDSDHCCVSNSLRCAVRCVPLQQPAKSGVRPKVSVAQRLHDIDTACWEARTDQNHRLVVVRGQSAPMLAVPLLGNFEGSCQVVNLLRLLAPPAFFILFRVNGGPS